MTEKLEYVPVEEASRILATLGVPLAPATLTRLRCVGGGPRFTKFGRTPMYARQSLEDWADSRISPEVAANSELRRRASGRQ